MRRVIGSAAAALLLLLASGCGGDDEGSATTTTAAAPATTSTTTTPVELPQDGTPVELKADDFVKEIDNPLWPMRHGSRWVYRERDAEGATSRIVVTVTDRKKTILGIEATVVHDVVTEDGELKEDTLDWYAQDKDGNVWYLGEDTKEYEGGKVVSTKGSWEAGVDGAQAGVIMPAQPEVGMTYRQEYYKGEAEDNAEVLSLDEHVKVAFGTFDRALQTKETTPLEPDVVEHKHYVRGIGLVLAKAAAGGSSREELLSYRKP
jgi:hypothetical protein